MSASKFFATAIGAASVVGAIGLAYAQTPSNDTSAQSRPADQGMQSQQMTNPSPATQYTQPNQPGGDPTLQTQQPTSRQGAGAQSRSNAIDGTEPAPADAARNAMGSPAVASPSVAPNAPVRPNANPQSTDSVTRSNGVDNSTLPSDGSADPAAMLNGTERAPQADRN